MNYGVNFYKRIKNRCNIFVFLYRSKDLRKHVNNISKSSQILMKKLIIHYAGKLYHSS